MEDKVLIDYLRQAKKILSDFFPAEATALLPVLFASFIWAVNGRAEVRRKILDLKVWLEPGMIENKPDDFILNFYKSRPELLVAYEEEVKRHDLKALRSAFKRLYPVIGLEDPFLQALFAAELENRDYRRLTAEFSSRLEKAISEIRSAGNQPGFWKELERLCGGFLELGWALLSEDEVRRKLKQLFSHL